MTQPAGEVQTSFADAVATLRFSHPKGNSLPSALLAGLAHEISALGARPDVRVVILRSTDQGPFCAGASFDELAAITDATAGAEFFRGFARVILAMRACPKPIIARVHGKAVGGGVGIVAAADYAMATASASVRLSELAVGIGPFVVGPAIEHKIGGAAFAAMAIDADWRTAQWAERAGLYARVYDTLPELDAAIAAVAGTVAASNPQALALIKAAVWRRTDDWETLLEERAQMSGTLVLSKFARDAIAAFAQRR